MDFNSYKSGDRRGGAILICFYVRKYVNLPAWVSSLFGISFLLHPMVHMATLSEFHGTILELFFVPLLFIALESFTRHLVNLRMKTAYMLLKEIPEDASLSLQRSLFHVGSHRKRVYMFSDFPPHAPFPAVKTDYVLVDTGRLFVQAQNFRGVIEELLSRQEYGVIKEEDGFILFKKGFPPTKNDTVLHRY